MLYAVPLHALNYPLNKSHLIGSLFSVHSQIVTRFAALMIEGDWLSERNVLIVEWAFVLSLTMVFTIVQ